MTLFVLSRSEENEQSGRTRKSDRFFFFYFVILDSRSNNNPIFILRVSESESRSSYFISNATISSATMFRILIIGLIAGPAVSLYGSPTVSPVTAAWWAGEPLPP